MNEEKPEECDSCQFKTDDIKLYPVDRNFPKEVDEKKWLCGLCAGTMTGVAHEYPEQYAGQEQTMKTICFVGNAILAAIKAAQLQKDMATDKFVQTNPTMDKFVQTDQTSDDVGSKQACEWHALGLCEITGYLAPHADVPVYTENVALPDHCPKCKLPIVVVAN